MIYIIYFISVIVTFWQSYYILTFKPANGDRAMAQGWYLILLGLIFVLVTSLLFLAMARRGSFHWMSDNASLRTLYIFLFWLTYVLTVFFGFMFAVEWHSDSAYPHFLNWLSLAYIFSWIPALVLISFFTLIQSSIVYEISNLFTRYSLYFSIGICALYSGGLLFGFIADKVQSQQIRMKNDAEEEDRFQLQALETIKNYSSSQNITELLSYSFVGRPLIIREAALKKIKERPNWEEEILEVLKDRNNYMESYYFLSGNKVDHPELFKADLNKSIISLTVDVGEYLKESNNIQYWTLDHFQIGRMLEAIDYQFSSDKSVFLPNILKLKESIVKNTPNESKKIKFTALIDIDLWLKKQ